MNDTKAARVLGWSSFVIGFAEIFAPRFLQRQLGLQGHRTLLRMLGVRECLSGLTILSGQKPDGQLTTGLWSRVAGDAMDLALLGAATRKTRRPTGLAGATAMVLAITAWMCFMRCEPSDGIRILQ